MTGASNITDLLLKQDFGMRFILATGNLCLCDDMKSGRKHY